MESKSINNLEFHKVLDIIASFAGSSAARDKILAIMPVDDKEQIKSWLSEVEEFQNYAQRGLQFSFSGIRDIREILEILKSGSHILASDDFMKVLANIKVANKLRVRIDSQHSIDFRGEIKGVIYHQIKNLPKLKHIGDRIEACFDEKSELRNNASPALATIRRELIQTKHKVEKQLQLYINEHSNDLQDSFFTIRNERYVIPVSASAQSRIQGIVHDQSSTGQTLFIEPLAFLPQNNRLAQLKLSEKEEIKRIFRALTDMLCQSYVLLERLFETIVHFDFLNAKIKFFDAYQCFKPEISEDRELKLIFAHHPLIHPDCVPLNVKMDSETKCIIITGPNGGGKTVTLKIIGLSAMLMQSGFFIPADSGSIIPIFSNILVDIGESQSIEEHLSTFTAHLKRLKEIYEHADGKSLILIDEICVGTDPEEGSALASGFLKEVIDKGNMAVVTSHYDSLKQMAFTTKKFINSSMEFDYDTFLPTFRFRMGVPGRSNALAIAKSYGIPEAILAELELRQSAEKAEEIKLLEAIERERTRSEMLRRKYVKKLSELRKKESDVEEGLKKLKEFRRTKRDQLTEKYTRELKNRLKELELIIHDLKKSSNKDRIEKKSSDLEKARVAHKIAKKTISKLDLDSEKTENFKNEINLDELEIGTEVIWKRTLRKGSITDIDKQKKRITLDFEGKKMKVDISEVSLAPKIAKHKKEKTFGRVYAKRELVRDEIDLRGLRVDEAIEKTETYLKNAEIQGLAKVYLIHGKGTGALQRAIKEFLQSGLYRKKFRSGRYGEGDNGVTVVVFDASSDTDNEELERLRRSGKRYI